MKGKRRILIVGQTPPPHNGQSIMIQKIVEGSYDQLEIYHVRMSFSRNLNEVGVLKASKIFHLFGVVFSILYNRFRYGIDTMYYPPTGPTMVPLYRDILILNFTRPFFKKICFHFHAAGVSELLPKLNLITKFLFQRAFHQADLCIRLSVNSTNDSKELKSKRELIIPYGIADSSLERYEVKKVNSVPVILFVGLLTESKGVLNLIEVCKILKDQNLKFSMKIVGEFKSFAFEKEVMHRVDMYGLKGSILFTGVLIGSEKFNIYNTSDIFCFPSFYEAESFPVVLLEACCFSLPIVTTQWRGIPSIVEDEKNGFLLPIKDNVKFAQKVKQLIENSELRDRLGSNARKVYEERYSINKFYESIEEAFYSI